MRIVHTCNDGRQYYVDIPNADPCYYRLGSISNCDLLIAYFGNYNNYYDTKGIPIFDTTIYCDHDHRVNDFPKLIEQMIIHDVVDPSIFQFLSNCIVPDVTKCMMSQTLVRCLNRGVTFRTREMNQEAMSHSKILSYSTIDKINDDCMTDDNISKFQSLRKLTIENEKVSLDFVDENHPLSGSLEELHVMRSCIRNARLYYFTSLKKLTIHDTWNEKLKFEIHRNHPFCDTLEEFSIDNCRITDTGIQHLRALRRLRITDNSKVRLAYLHPRHPQCDLLEELVLETTNVRDVGIRHLRKLTKLIVDRSDKIKLEFLGKIHGSQRHPLCDSLTDLSIASTHIGDDSIKYLQKLKKLDIHYNSVVKLDFFRPTSESDRSPLLDSLEELIVGKTSVDDSAIEHLTRLKTLNMTNNRTIRFDFLHVFHPLCNTLEYLHAISTNLTDDKIDKLHALSILNVARNQSITFDFLGRKTNGSDHPLCYNLKELNINGTAVTDESLKHLQNLEKISFDSHVNLDFLKNPSHPLCNTLVEIYTSGSFSDKNLQHLRVLEKLETGNINPITLDFIHARHPLCETLTTLNLRKSSIDDENIRHFRMLKNLGLDSDHKIKIDFLHPSHRLCFTLDNMNVYLSNRRRIEIRRMFKYSSIPPDYMMLA